MQLEIQIALNFVISYMFNKLPRRRVNIFGEELEKALRAKFEGHWYPNQPMKGSAFRCLKTGDPVDIVLVKAAREAGMELREITENLPEDLAVWVDPGEVSYRIGEKGQVKVLYSEAEESASQEATLDREVTKTFNPDAQCFEPIDALSSSLSSVSISPKSVSPFSTTTAAAVAAAASVSSVATGSPPLPPMQLPPAAAFKSPREATPPSATTTAFLAPKANSQPLTFTIASFAQTKFGSTKLKTSTKRPNRMSPTEFSHYIKQRQMQQQQQHHHHHPNAMAQQHQQMPAMSVGAGSSFGSFGGANNVASVSRPRSLSPSPLGNDQNIFFNNNSTANTAATNANNAYNPWGQSMFEPPANSSFASASFFNELLPPNPSQSAIAAAASVGNGKFSMYDPLNSVALLQGSNSATQQLNGPTEQSLGDPMMGLYPPSQYPSHLLVAN